MPFTSRTTLSSDSSSEASLVIERETASWVDFESADSLPSVEESAVSSGASSTTTTGTKRGSEGSGYGTLNGFLTVTSHTGQVGAARKKSGRSSLGERPPTLRMPGIPHSPGDSPCSSPSPGQRQSHKGIPSIPSGSLSSSLAAQLVPLHRKQVLEEPSTWKPPPKTAELGATAALASRNNGSSGSCTGPATGERRYRSPGALALGGLAEPLTPLSPTHRGSSCSSAAAWGERAPALLQLESSSYGGTTSSSGNDWTKDEEGIIIARTAGGARSPSSRPFLEEEEIGEERRPCPLKAAAADIDSALCAVAEEPLLPTGCEEEEAETCAGAAGGTSSRETSTAVASSRGPSEAVVVGDLEFLLERPFLGLETIIEDDLATSPPSSAEVAPAVMAIGIESEKRRGGGVLASNGILQQPMAASGDPPSPGDSSALLQQASCPRLLGPQAVTQLPADLRKYLPNAASGQAWRQRATSKDKPRSTTAFVTTSPFLRREEPLKEKVS